MKNPYLQNLQKIEFVVTDACTGKCKHCSQGDHHGSDAHVDAHVAANAVRKIAAQYDVQTVMTFGGEPLLYPDAVYAIISTAAELGIARRQVITNGYFSKDQAYIATVAKKLAESGVNDLLLSVDAFHQETIPLDVVYAFAAQAKACGIPMRLSPAWLVSPEHDNPYNNKTRAVLHHFSDLHIPVGEGNIVFPEGNARKYLAEYFTESCPANPYEENPHDLRCLSFCANGNLLGGNIYRQDVMDILRNYQP